MPRLLCPICQRPKPACICQFIAEVENDVLIIVLLHPNEVKQSKGTLPLLANGLSRCIVIEGENFSHNDQLNHLLAQYGQQAALLYPSEQSVNLSQLTQSANTQNIHCLILLDATWKKAYRMYMLSENLHHIQHVTLPDDLLGQYHIRKTSKKNGLSTLEACCYALQIVEQTPNKYQNMLDKFVEFNHFQLSFRPNKDA